MDTLAHIMVDEAAQDREMPIGPLGVTICRPPRPLFKAEELEAAIVAAEAGQLRAVGAAMQRSIERGAVRGSATIYRLRDLLTGRRSEVR